jgi:hypothetical protein
MLTVINRYRDLCSRILDARADQLFRPFDVLVEPSNVTPRRSATGFIVTLSRPTSLAAPAIIGRLMPVSRPTFELPRALVFGCVFIASRGPGTATLTAARSNLAPEPETSDGMRMPLGRSLEEDATSLWAGRQFPNVYLYLIR